MPIFGGGGSGLSPIAAKSVLANSQTISALPIAASLGTGLSLSKAALLDTTLQTVTGNQGLVTISGAPAVSIGMSNTLDNTLIGNYTTGTVAVVGGPVVLAASFNLSAAGTLSLATIAATSLLGNKGTAVAAPADAIGLGLGLSMNSGTISAHSQITVAATAGTNTITLAASTTNVLINGPAGGGACTLALTGAVAIDQRIVMNVSQGATAATWVFGAGFNFGTTVPSPTITAVAAKRDTMALINNVGTVFDMDAIIQGFSP